MSAGTITLTNNSAAVSGTGTAFTTDLKAGDFIVSVVGGVTYTLPVKTVNSATGVTLLKNYDGPTQTGAAWSAVPRDAMNAITAQLAAETAQALRGLNYDKQNWQQVFSATGNVTVKLPDGSSFTGPAWGGIVTQINDIKTDPRWDTVNNKTGGRVTSPLDVGGSVHVITQFSSWGVYGFKYPSTLLQMAYWFCENFGDLVFVTTAATKPGTEKYFSMRQNGDFNTQGNISCVSLIQTCDRDAKDNIEPIENPLEKLDKVNGYTYLFKDSGLPSAGIIAQEFKEILPDIISTKSPLVPKYNDEGEMEGVEPDSDLNNLTYGVEPMGVIGFLVAALKAEKLEREKLGMALADLKGKVDLLLSKE
ncbi:tail fiber domain-containing protein [Hafnia alvei]|uniref:tail fiber domain-containing protein n=1 Tax=Hafnia alvei TaxID=569 RepID=UPI0040442531